MALFKSLKSWLSPPRQVEPDLGPLTYMYIARYPERSYWEAEWTFPATNNNVSIALEGDESGPSPMVREWYLGLPARFPRIIELVRPHLATVFNSWCKQNLPDDIFTVMRLSGFGVEDLAEQPVRWD